MRALAFQIALLTLLACGSHEVTSSTLREPPTTTLPSDGETAVAETSGIELSEVESSEVEVEPCREAEVPVYRDGQIDGSVCPRDLDAEGLTLVDLSDEFTPYIFSESSEGGRHPYRSVFLALADERLNDVPSDFDQELYLELFGIFPTFRVLIDRLAETDRHECHDAIDDRFLEVEGPSIRPWRPAAAVQRRALRRANALKRRLESIVQREGFESIHDLEEHEEHGRRYADWFEANTMPGAIEAVQAHLRCDEMLTRRRVPRAILETHTSQALGEYQRRHMVVSAGFLDNESRAALAEDSRTTDFESVLRALRERVVSATGLIEDGSASHSQGLVLGHQLDAPQIRFDAGREPHENGAPDLISVATEAAALALGWTDPASALEGMRAVRDAGHQVVALPLPPVPEYHSAHMELRGEVDRGDIFYHYPYSDTGRPIGGRVRVRPVVTLYVEHGGQEIALARWPTTVGGWKPETRPDGTIGLRYKNSPEGERVWRDVIAAPTWLPPRSTPNDELVQRRRGEYRLRQSIFGPGYRSAYGLVMMMHHQVVESEDGQPRFIDEGIRAHGSVSYRSITRGTSHGCHRLYNHLAVRLASFLLSHRNHTRVGRINASYERQITIYAENEGSDVEQELLQNGALGILAPNSINVEPEIEARLDLEIDTRGYQFELTPPVPVTVTRGNVRGPRDTPIEQFMPLRDELVDQVRAEAAEDG